LSGLGHRDHAERHENGRHHRPASERADLTPRSYSQDPERLAHDLANAPPQAPAVTLVRNNRLGSTLCFCLRVPVGDDVGKHFYL
jgi:hypothetical protein